MSTVDENQTFVLRVPWGTFGPGAQWEPAPLVNMTKDEQWADNVKNGYLPQRAEQVEAHTQR